MLSIPPLRPIFADLVWQDQQFDYEALSYAWGSKDDPSHVLVRGNGNRKGKIQITRSLDEALRHLRNTRKHRLFWIDALCINQADDAEKGSQVAMTGDIYRLAGCVTAWLGPEGDGNEAAFDLVREWARHVRVDWNSEQLRPSDTTDEPHWADENVCLP